MIRKYLIVIAATSMFICNSAPLLAINTPLLGASENFAVLGHTTVTNTGPSVIFGGASTLANVGVYNLGSVADVTTGFSSAGNTFIGPGSNTNGPGLVVAPAAIHLGSATANVARNDLITAYTALSSYGTAADLTGDILGDGVGGTQPILAAGVYNFDTSAQLNGTLKLDAMGLDGGVWIFQIGTTLTTASASAVQLINPGGNLGSDVGVYWVVGSSATLGTTTAFEGNILAQTSITLNTSATIYNGRALAIDGAVTLDTNTISDICPPASSSPNSGPGFSRGLMFDENGNLVPVGPDVPAEPGIGVIGLGNVIADGSAAALLNGTDFGAVGLNAIAQQTFTITNTGTAPLLLGSLILTGDYSLIGMFPTSIAIGDSASFIIALNTSIAGPKTGTATFDTSAPGSPFNFNLNAQVVIQQEGIPEPASAILGLLSVVGFLMHGRSGRRA